MSPLYLDPANDGPADPTVIWNPDTRTWWMYYTSRRANNPDLPGVSWVHGTPIGIAESADDGATWTYIGDAGFKGLADQDLTLWAPEVFTHEGTHHMFLTVVPGIYEDWGHERRIVHLTSTDLRTWGEPRNLDLASHQVLDACVLRLDDGTWRLWYNDEPSGKTTHYADSPDLRTWTDRGLAVGDQAGEGPNVFRWRGRYWMVVDVWDGQAVYHSDDTLTWVRQPGQILQGQRGLHADVVVCGDRAFLFYFTHPGPGDRRSEIEVVELELQDGRVVCGAARAQLTPPDQPS
jgi:hypothetical protein